MLLLWQALLSFILPVHLAGADHAAPRTRRAQEGRGAVAPPVVVAVDVVAAAVSPVVVAAAAVVAAALVLAVAVLVVVAGVGPDQRRVAHAADDVFHAGPLGAEVLVRQSVQVEGGEGEGLRGSVGAVARRGRLPPEGGGGRWRRKRRPWREAVRGAVSLAGGVAAAVLGLDLRAATGQISTPLSWKTGIRVHWKGFATRNRSEHE